MRTSLKQGLQAVDQGMSGLGARVERPSLICFLFHSLFESEEQISSGVMHPQERLTPSALRVVLEHLLEHGYRFVSMADIVGGSLHSGRYAHITLDDGYANNLVLVELLHTYRVPATLFVSTNHVDQGKSFWWDVVYRGRHGRADARSVEREITSLASRGHREIDRYLESEFGAGALRPQGDLDRPLTAAELLTLARDPLITLGNHTTDHAFLTRCAPDEAESQIAEAQRYLRGVTGVSPESISFPHGGYSDHTLVAARRVGLRAGMTIESRKNRLPIGEREMIRLGRFSVTCDQRLEDRLRLCRSGVRLERGARRLLRRPG